MRGQNGLGVEWPGGVTEYVRGVTGHGRGVAGHGKYIQVAHLQLARGGGHCIHQLLPLCLQRCHLLLQPAMLSSQLLILLSSRRLQAPRLRRRSPRLRRCLPLQLGIPLSSKLCSLCCARRRVACCSCRHMLALFSSSKALVQLIELYLCHLQAALQLSRLQGTAAE